MTPRATLLDYCASRQCRTCPMNTPELGVLADGDLCVVSLAIDALPQDEAASVDADYEAARADACPVCGAPGGGCDSCRAELRCDP